MFGIFIILTLEGAWQDKVIGILMVSGVLWYMYAILFKDVFKDKSLGG
ncbi:unnamed protein product [marine sediment metagenome]|uniref:Uncharacterized protein n=1 Tax=marine sediment metagenome TaxID=412755 RepID=X1CAH8_9ZZZZ